MWRLSSRIRACNQTRIVGEVDLTAQYQIAYGGAGGGLKLYSSPLASITLLLLAELLKFRL